jgi:hypothetical protein
MECAENLNLVQIGQKYRAFYTKTKVHVIAAGDIKSPYMRSFRLKWYKTVSPSVRLHNRMYQRCSHWTDFRNIGDYYGTFIETCREVPNMIKVGQKNRALYMKT